MPNTLKGQRIFELDYIPAISAIFVLLFHYTTQYDNSLGHEGNWPLAVPFGAMAVNTFFLLTGYLTVRFYSGGFGAFAYKHWCRLWPTFAVSVVITSVFMALLMPERLRTIPEILLNFTMFPAYLGARSVDGVYWTMAVEVIFYFWIAVIMWLTKKKTPALLTCLYGWVLLSIVANLCKTFGILSMPTGFVQILFATEHSPCMILGASICLRNAQKGVSWRNIAPLWLCCLCGIWTGRGVAVVIWSLLWALLIWAITSDKLHFALSPKNFVHKCLAFIAGISYPLYLLHQFIGFAIIQKLERMGAINEIWIVVPIAVSILLAAAVHYWFEIPVYKLLLRLSNKKVKTTN